MLKTVSSIVNAIGALNYKGTWDANTNTPTLVSSVGTKGDYYVVSVAGSTNLNGETNWGVGDWAVFNGSVWQKVDGGSTGNFTDITVSNSATLSYGTANGVAYLNASKVLTTGSALTFDGARLGVGTASPDSLGLITTEVNGNSLNISRTASTTGRAGWFSQNTAETIRLFSEVYGASATNTGFGQTLAGYGVVQSVGTASNGLIVGTSNNTPLIFGQNNAEAMRLTSTGLGIGTTTPGVRLDVSGPNGNFIRYTSTGGVSAILGDSSGNVGQTGTTTNHPFLFLTNATERMRLDSSGNLGLGVTPSAWNSGYKAIQNLTSSLFGTTSRDMNLGANVFINSGGNYAYIQSSFATNYTQYNGVHSWYTAPSGTAGNTISFSQVMTLDASGNLGIGLTNPARALEVRGSIQASTAGGIQSVLWSEAVAGAGGTGTNSNHPFAFLTNGTERARIPSAGGFVVGTAALATNATTGFLYVPTCAGTPTGTPATQTGTAPIVVDTTNNKLYFYSGGQWRDAGP